MSSTDPVDTARTAKATDALLREARSALRRLDKLVSAAGGLDDATAERMAREAVDAAQRLVDHLVRLRHVQKRRAQEALRRSR